MNFINVISRSSWIGQGFSFKSSFFCSLWKNLMTFVFHFRVCIFIFRDKASFWLDALREKVQNYCIWGEVIMYQHCKNNFDEIILREVMKHYSMNYSYKYCYLGFIIFVWCMDFLNFLNFIIWKSEIPANWINLFFLL